MTARDEARRRHPAGGAPADGGTPGTGTSPRTGAAPGPADAPVHARPRWARIAVPAAWVLGVLTSLTVLLVFVFPTRTYLHQRRDLQLTAAHARLLDEQNARLTAEAAKLHDPAEIERLARERYHLVRPGEQAFAILPPPAPATTVAPAAPAAHHGGGIWHDLTSLLP